MSLRVENVSIHLAEQCFIRDLGFQVSAGDVLTVMGPSGCGKSSLLNFICGNLDEEFVSSGQIYLNDSLLNHLPAHRRGIGLQFQDHMLFPHMTVGENLEFGIPRQYRKTDRKRKVEQALADCGLKGISDQNPAKLSGGQQARISLMRTLLSEPKLLLLDEPFSKLDTNLREQFRQFVFNQIKNTDIPALMVTHDPQDISEKGKLIEL